MDMLGEEVNLLDEIVAKVEFQHRLWDILNRLIEIMAELDIYNSWRKMVDFLIKPMAKSYVSK